jgi:hypothetical protein
MWMNKDNLATCLNTKEHCGEGLILKVEDLTDYVNETEKLLRDIHKHLKSGKML